MHQWTDAEPWLRLCKGDSNLKSYWDEQHEAAVHGNAHKNPSFDGTRWVGNE